MPIAVSSRPHAATTAPTITWDTESVWPRTKSGTFKQKLTWEEKLHVLDPTSPPAATEARLVEFRNLFAFRFTNAIITRAGQDSRSWIALPGFLYVENIIRHLLADRIPDHPPVWVGARSLPTTRFFAIDVDADRSERTDETDPAKRRQRRSIPPFADRCGQVERALRSLGINPKNPRHVLIQPTPSGGRHYFIFLDASYHVSVGPEHLWDAVGLTHIPGQIEFFPSQTHGLRLPFGHIPGRPHDPTAWIQFIKDYHDYRIKRWHVPDLLERARQAQLAARARPVRAAAAEPAPAPTSPRPASPTRTDGRAAVARAGIPKRFRSADPSAHPGARFHDLMRQDKLSFQDAEGLLSLGIRLRGYRTKVLKALAAHLIWFRHLPHEEAAQLLTTWAYNPILRHDSTDIQADLARGTRRVARQLTQMCRWYAEHQQLPSDPGAAVANDADVIGQTGPRFAPSELQALWPFVQSLPPEDRTGQAQFLLSFLWFAKRHGRASVDQAGWFAAPAVAKVIRRWPGCNHQNYKKWMQRADAAGIFKMVREKWQNPKGKGRARTYGLRVPVVADGEWTVDYAAALKFLTDELAPAPTPVNATVSTPPAGTSEDARVAAADHDPDTVSRDPRPTGADNLAAGLAVAAADPGHPATAGEPDPERTHADEPTDRSSGADAGSTPGTDPTDLRSPGPRIDLEPHSRERHPQPAPAVGVPRRVAGTVPAIPAATAAPTETPAQPPTSDQLPERPWAEKLNAMFPPRAPARLPTGRSLQPVAAAGSRTHKPSRQLPPGSDNWSFAEKENWLLGLTDDENQTPHQKKYLPRLRR